MTTGTERPTVAVAITVEVRPAARIRNHDAYARWIGQEIADLLMEQFESIVSVNAKPVSAGAQREHIHSAGHGSTVCECGAKFIASEGGWQHEDAADAASDDRTPIPVSAAAMESIGEPMDAPDDETEHRIGVLRDDADALDRIYARQSWSPPPTAGWLRDMADRLERGSA